MNEQSHKKITPQNHLNLLDLALVLLALLSIVAIWQRSNLRFFFEGEREKSSYTVAFTVSAVRADTAELLQADTVLYVREGETAHELGRLAEDATVLPHTVLMPKGDGSVAEVLLQKDDPRALFDLNGSFTCRGVLRDGALVLEGGITLSPDMELSVFTSRGEMQIFVRSITENL